jgi:ribosomal-protein-alanine N-acetyltransferase
VTDTQIVAIRPEHIDAVAAIHGANFDDPWDSGMLRRVLAMPGAFGYVAIDRAHDTVVGFALSRIAADECELLSLAVEGPRRRAGIGGSLLQASMARALSAGAIKFFLEVAETNRDAQRLYAAHGLVQVGRRPGYYELKNGGVEAALTLKADLSCVTQDIGASD